MSIENSFIKKQEEEKKEGNELNACLSELKSIQEKFISSREDALTVSYDDEKKALEMFKKRTQLIIELPGLIEPILKDSQHKNKIMEKLYIMKQQALEANDKDDQFFHSALLRKRGSNDTQLDDLIVEVEGLTTRI
ncbi:hypothetical protein A2303_03285 [Candidatus Falkowbacteria bacterium RIFOXYB2_FULL_47_14]|uniref:Uncharacterized protein n=1 Tax=Candidatus Falkowbacteria bacterium RIFOXYA2_FULL_47_19 TaxID=1797994 RepID=A0A1F5SK77_9BACT|nr:MAG: hypothetical protein A2227_04380 [Candidatus Falkowbacteria bacterium RIFOXYA2_FULL_47_19]OGF36996.1 MAG: hypothetical protein A2468_01320 [Candidatus Falkowbacteria bacterium RIFOXYC2_FULL_46_15]OGF44032.1 MAG: hypothetical protein A2303_03285 [Candidatus Falkowbacteria bacterium RIFOXYB2_FULL_47_14]